MRRKLRGKISVLLAAAIMCASLAGCSGKTKDNSIAVSEDTSEERGNVQSQAADMSVDSDNNKTVDMEKDSSAMGRYMESEIILPENMDMLNAGRALSDGRLRVLVTQPDGPAVYDSRDNGASWELAFRLPEEYKDSYINVASISEGGAVFCNLGVGEAGEDGVPEMGCAEISSEGEFYIVPVNLPDMGEDDIMYLLDPAYAEEGKVLFKVVGSDKLYLIDTKTGERLRVYNEDEKPVQSVKMVGNDIYIFSDDSVWALDYESGEEITVDEVLKDTLESRKENFFMYNFYTYPILFGEGQQEGELYFCNAEGIFRYIKGGSLVEQLADGNLNSLAKPSVALMSMQVLTDGSFLVFADDGGAKLLHYVYDPDVPTTPGTVLRVYSLRENQDVQQAISMFQNQNPDYYVELEIGMTGDDAVTASDALRTLNTEIMAGNGPDVLILDGMPMDSYMEKGILADISAEIKEVSDGNEIFENITGIYERDGAVYAVPSRFKVPVINGVKEDLDAISDLASLADKATALKAENSDIKMIMNISSIYWLIKEVYGAYSPALLNEEGRLNEEALTGFLETMKTLFDLNEYQEGEAIYRNETTAGDAGSYDYTMLSGSYEWLTHSVLLDLLNLGTGMGFAELISLNERENLDYRLSPLSGKNVFIPSVIAGVSSRSNEVEGAKAFLKFLLSEDAQKGGMGGGFPVNKKAFKEELVSGSELGFGTTGWTTMDEDGNMEDISFDILNPSEEKQEELLSLAESLDTPSLTDAVVEEMVQNVAGSYIKGEISVEDAVSGIKQKMSLYLAE